ncbi:MAG: DUF4388 domain-containing protein [Nitrospiraceae bacterium]|nr:DUF4388 domain-containing protein [Nitrospiraceae bacterium]
MALEGSLKDFGLADILQLIHLQRKTGVLSLEGRMDKIRLIFYQGNIISAESKRRNEANRLGKVLVKKGLITEQELQEVMQVQNTTGEKIGTLLVKKGTITKEQIQAIIISQVTETVVQIFNWKEGTYEFTQHGVPIDADLPITIDTQHLLMEGLRIIDEWSLIEGKLSLDTIFDRMEKPGISLTADEASILELIDGENDVSTIIDASHMENLQASKIFVSLLEKGLIEPKETAPVEPVQITQYEIRPLKKTGPSVSFAGIFTTIIFVISALLAFAAFPAHKNAYALNKIKTVEDIDSIRFLVEVYKYEKGSYPSTLDQITKIKDKWGNPYVYKIDSNTFVIYSLGPDGKEGTEDDIY